MTRRYGIQRSEFSRREIVSFLCVKVRNRLPEWMDQPGLDPQLHAQALQGLRRVNRLSATARQLWQPMQELAAQKADGSLRILDLASGGGDVALEIARLAAQSQRSVAVEGWDISPIAVEYANAQARDSGATNVSFAVRDALQESVRETYDVVMCSLFLHHLDEPEVVQILARMAQLARRLVLVDDLVRSRWGYVMAWAGCRLLSRSPIVHVDGPRSVAGAFSSQEMANLANQAGLTGHQITRHWPERFLLSWKK